MTGIGTRPKKEEKESKVTNEPVSEKMLILQVQPDPTIFAKIKDIIKNNPGNTVVKLLIDNNGKNSELIIKDKISITDPLLKEVGGIVGQYRLE